MYHPSETWFGVLLVVTVTSNLSWNEHINDEVKKASKRLYCLEQVKRAKLPCKDLVLFYGGVLHA